ncbi:MAG: FlgD immunoglobulin-like domain containing protein, partial [bacterium]
TLDVGGGVVVFFDEFTGGFEPGQISLLEGPVIDLDLLEITPGSLSFGFSGFTNPLPPDLVLVVGSRVDEGAGWSAWEDQHLILEPGDFDTLVTLTHSVIGPGQPLLLQNRIGVMNLGGAPVSDPGPVIDDVTTVAGEEQQQAYTKWKYVPDISQGKTGKCMASAFANCLSYWAGNGYPELLPTKATLAERHEKLVEELRKACYKDDVGSTYGATKYMKDKKVYKGQPQPGTPPRKPLVSRTRKASIASWSWIKSQFNSCHDILFEITWCDSNGNVIDPDASHQVTVAGIEEDANGNIKLHVANPWGKSHHTVTEATRGKAYDTLTVKLDASGNVSKMNNKELETKASGISGAASLCLSRVTVIRPYTAKDGAPDTGVTCRRTPAGKAMAAYDYLVENELDGHLNYFALNIDVPYTNVLSPPGWNWVPLPANLQGEPGCGAIVGHDGILWWTDTDPILPGMQLSGFLFEADDSYPLAPLGLVSYAETEEGEGIYNLADGPVRVSITEVTDEPPPRPTRAELLAATPNPFNPSTTITFRVRAEGPVKVTVYDLLGRRVRTLADGRFGVGLHRLPWDGQDEAGETVAAGVYCVRLDDGTAVQVLKVALLK